MNASSRQGPGSAGVSRWTMLALLSLAELLGMSLWFTASAVSPQLRELWDLSAAQAGRLTTVVQLGFVAGTAVAALLNLADLIPSRPYFASAAVAAATANAALVLAPGYPAALVTRFFVGFFLAGVYPPAMKMISTWFRAGRGVAIGTLVGALTVGKATPYLVHGLESLDYRGVVLSATAAALVAAALVALLYHDGPEAFARRPFSWQLVGTVVRHRETRLAIAGYLGHMWELYAMWTLIAGFLFDYFTGRGMDGRRVGFGSGVGAFAMIAAGGLGAVLAGKWADRTGRERVTIWAMAVSGACCLVFGWLLQAPPALVVCAGLVWGFAVVADSAQFSAVVTEVAPQHAVGTALTLQTSLGFLLTAASIAVAIEVETRWGWGVAFGMLALGPALGIVAMARLRRLRSSSGSAP